jgi:TusE/DsrC/DsvC family sulfur relay protein
MPSTTIADCVVDIDDEGFMTKAGQWNQAIGASLATAIDIPMSDEHWKVISFARDDYASQGETPTIRRMSTAGGFDTKRLFALFPKKPAKKIAYIAGLPKPHGCV